jgi:hypothetical protein
VIKPLVAARADDGPSAENDKTQPVTTSVIQEGVFMVEMIDGPKPASRRPEYVLFRCFEAIWLLAKLFGYRRKPFGYWRSHLVIFGSHLAIGEAIWLSSEAIWLLAKLFGYRRKLFGYWRSHLVIFGSYLVIGEAIWLSSEAIWLLAKLYA